MVHDGNPLDIRTVPPNYDLYMKASAAMVDIIRHYSPRVQRFSIDECFVEYTSDGGKADPVTVAEEIRQRMGAELGFTVNIGVSINKILAKMWPLPVGELIMVGRQTEAKLRNIGLVTIGDLATANTKMLYSHLKSHAYTVQNYANGIDYSPVRKSNHEIVKGKGNSTTIRFDVYERYDVNLVLISLAESVGMRLRAAGFCQYT